MTGFGHRALGICLWCASGKFPEVRLAAPALDRTRIRFRGGRAPPVTSAFAWSRSEADRQPALIVGDDYRKPDTSGATAATTSDGGKNVNAAQEALTVSLGRGLGERSLARSARQTPRFPGQQRHLDAALDRENGNSVGFTATGEGWAVGPKGRNATFAK